MIMQRSLIMHDMKEVHQMMVDIHHKWLVDTQDLHRLKWMVVGRKIQSQELFHLQLLQTEECLPALLYSASLLCCVYLPEKECTPCKKI